MALQKYHVSFHSSSWLPILVWKELNSDPQSCSSALSLNNWEYYVLTLWGLIQPVSFGDHCNSLVNTSKPERKIINSLLKCHSNHPQRSSTTDETLLVVLASIPTLLSTNGTCNGWAWNTQRLKMSRLPALQWKLFSEVLNLGTFSEVELPLKPHSFNFTDPLRTFGDANSFTLGEIELPLSIEMKAWKTCKANSKSIKRIYKLLKSNIWMSCIEMDQKHME